MARPKKIGLDYFPLDVHLEDQVELLEAEHGLVGYAILIKLWQKIYSEGYYIEWTEDNALLFARKNNTELTLVNSVINTCLHRNLFDKLLYEQYTVLTSKGIQSRYDKVCIDAKRKHTSYKKELLLIKTEFTTEETELTQEESTQSKEEEIREDNSKENKKKNTRFALPSVDEIKQYCQERNNNVDAETFIDFYTAKDWFVGKNKMKDWKAAVRTWEKRSYNNIPVTQTKPKVVAPWYKGDEQIE